MNTNGAEKPKLGRPKKHIDLELVEKLAHIQCTYAEIASTLGISVDTLQRNEHFAATYKRGAEGGRKSLRRMQFESANRGNVTMQIWLGKQYLGQSDQRTELQLRPEDLDPNQLVTLYQNMHPWQQQEFLEAYHEQLQIRLAELRGLPSATVTSPQDRKTTAYNGSAAGNADEPIDVVPVKESESE